MKIIVCGAGVVGLGIANYLASESHEVTIVDRSETLLKSLTDTLDVRTVLGYGSHPSVLQEAGARDADLLIAVTPFDELNMVICEVADVLFKVPRKIARIRDQNYLDKRWGELFEKKETIGQMVLPGKMQMNESQPQRALAIDLTISPERRAGEEVLRLLGTSGLFTSRDLVKGEVCLGGIAVKEECPVAGVPFGEWKDLFPGLRIMVGGDCP